MFNVIFSNRGANIRLIIEIKKYLMYNFRGCLFVVYSLVVGGWWLVVGG